MGGKAASSSQQPSRWRKDDEVSSSRQAGRQRSSRAVCVADGWPWGWGCQQLQQVRLDLEAVRPPPSSVVVAPPVTVTSDEEEGAMRGSMRGVRRERKRDRLRRWLMRPFLSDYYGLTDSSATGDAQRRRRQAYYEAGQDSSSKKRKKQKPVRGVGRQTGGGWRWLAGWLTGAGVVVLLNRRTRTRCWRL